MRLVWGLALVASLLCSSCIRRRLSPVEYAKWVNNEKNGLIVKRNVDGIEYKLQYKPLNYVALLEQNGSKSISRKQFEKDKAEMDSFEYYTLYISTTSHKNDLLSMGSASVTEYAARINYFANMMQGDIYLKVGNKKVPCALYHYERDYNLTPFQKFSLAFPVGAKDAQQDHIIVFNDEILTHKVVELAIPATILKSIPELKIN